MRLRFADLASEAAQLWRSDRDLLLRIAGVFFLLPSFGLSLFTPSLNVEMAAPVDGVTLTAAETAARQAEFQAQFLAWFGDVWPWMMAAITVQLLGTAIILLMYLVPDRPPLGQAITRALQLWPSVVAGWILSGILCTIGFFAFVLPGLYITGRTYLTSAVIVAENRGPATGLTRGIQLSRGFGWVLTGTYLMVQLAGFFAGVVIGGFGGAVQGIPLANGLLTLLLACVSALALLASALLQVTAYRRLAGSRTGM